MPTLSSGILIFPADAGVNLGTERILRKMWNIPRGCGGEPDGINTIDEDSEYSPRMRG